VNDRRAEREQRVTPLELCFDLVFVFAITQVTGFLFRDPTWGGLVRGLLLLGALWWAWGAYAWLTNTLDPRKAPFGSRCSPRSGRCSWCRSPCRARSALMR
jgi:low temperature requirement protein LtrA